MLSRAFLCLSLVVAASLGFGQSLLPPRVTLPAHLAGPKNEVVPDRLLVKVAPEQASMWQASPGLRRMAAASMRIPGVFANQIGPSGWTLWLLERPTDTRKLADAMRSVPGVFDAQPVNRMYLMIAEPNDPDFRKMEDNPEMYLGDPDSNVYRRLWYLEDIYAEEGWTIWPNQWYSHTNRPTNSPRIAIIDTGLDLNHHDYRNGGPSIDYLQGGQIDMAHSKEFRFGAVYGPGTPFDQYGHGTHVAGLALASGNNGGLNGRGIIGVGYPAIGMILRVFDDTAFATDAEAAAAIYYAADHGAEVINLSLGTTNYSQTLQDAVTYAWQKGSLVVAAGGNSQPRQEQIFYPAGCSGAIGVSPLGPDYFMASNYGSEGPQIDIAAPGGDLIIDFGTLTAYAQYIYSTTKIDPHMLSINAAAMGLLGYRTEYGHLIGSSTSAPMVAGAAALYFGKNNLRQDTGWANQRAYLALQKSAWHPMQPSFGTWEPKYGYGVLDVEELLQDSNTRNATVGSIQGRVYKNATPVANVLVRATNVNTGQQFQTTTRQDGGYRFQLLLPGIYDVQSAPDGLLKTLRREVFVGGDITGVDFWCGSFTWDTTPPSVPRFQVLSATVNSVTVRHRAYDTETGVDTAVWRIGTAPGLADVMADRLIVPGLTDQVVLSGLSLTAGPSYHLRGTYTNGAGMTTVVDTVFGVGNPVTGTVQIQHFGAASPPRPITFQLRSPGTTTVLQTVTVTPNTNGEFLFTTTQSGLRDLAAKGAHTLRQVIPNVNFGSGSPSGLNFTLVNGDVNGDNVVNIADFLALRAALGSSSGSGAWNPHADLDGNGTVNIADFLILRQSMGQTGAP